MDCIPWLWQSEGLGVGVAEQIRHGLVLTARSRVWIGVDGGPITKRACTKYGPERCLHYRIDAEYRLLCCSEAQCMTVLLLVAVQNTQRIRGYFPLAPELWMTAPDEKGK